MRNILVPVDFSTYSLSASKAAAVIARKCGSHIHLLHIANVPVGWEKQSVAHQEKYPMLKNRLMEANTRLQKFAERSFFKGCHISTTVHGGVAFEQINLFAKRHKHTLIVMGVHGDGESELKFIGSTAQRVIRTTPCPVLSVKKTFTFRNLKKILFASDFQEDVHSAVNSIKNLASDFRAHIDFAYINTASHFVDDETMQERMRQFIIVQKRVKFQTVVQNCQDKESGILLCAKKRHASIIAMSTHLRKANASYSLGVMESVLFRSRLPVLSFVIDEPRYRIR